MFAPRSDPKAMRHQSMGIETVKSKSGHFNWKFRFFHVDWAEIAAGAIGLVLLILVIYFRVWMTHSITPT
jgi:hypothetical protein